MEQLAYERRVEQQRLRAEIVQEKRKAEHFSQQVPKPFNWRQTKFSRNWCNAIRDH
jgi:hypothetical protein